MELLGNWRLKATEGACVNVSVRQGGGKVHMGTQRLGKCRENPSIRKVGLVVKKEVQGVGQVEHVVDT